MKVRKAIITAAGLGTRFLPAAKSYQKEMVPVMEKPQIQRVIEEAIESDISEIAVVVREGKDTFHEYLKDDDKLWAFLKEVGKEQVMDSWVAMKEACEITVFEQKESDPYGNGTPFILTKEFAAKEPIAAMFGDDIMIHTDKSKPTVVKQLINLYEQHTPTAIISSLEIPRHEINLYGCSDYFRETEAKVPHQIKDIIEKPEPDKAPSLMATTCRFILTNSVFEELAKKTQGKNNEIWLTDAIGVLVRKGHIVMAPPVEGSIWAPVGDPLRWLHANIIVALNDPKYSDDTKKMLREVSSE